MTVYYREIKQEKKVFRSCFESKLPLLLKGPTGCGKSQYVAAMAFELKRPLIVVACNEDTSAADMLGRFLIKKSETIWQDGPVTRAVRDGAILYLDEVAEAREDVLVALHPLTDHRRQLFIDRTNESIQAPENFMCVASFNPGYQRSFKELKPSTRQRFVTLNFEYPDKKTESEIICRISGVDFDSSSRLTKFAEKIRSQPELALKETVSTRLLVHTATLIHNGMNPRLACEVGIVQALTDDQKVSRTLIDMAALFF